jgi:flagellar motility protein MotE (MotC chaperone)
MMAKIKSPLAAVALSLILSVTMGVFLCVQAAAPLLVTLAKTRVVAAPPKARDGFDFWTVEMDNLANDLRDERAKLHKQSDALDQREARIAAEEKELDRVRANIEALRKQIADKVTEVTADEVKNVRTLAQTYTSLSPKAVVAIFKEMDDVTCVKILSQMKPDVVGPIFEEMSKGADGDVPLARRAATLSERLRLLKSSKAPGTP